MCLRESLGQQHAAYHAYKLALEADPHYGPALDNMKRYCDRVWPRLPQSVHQPRRRVTMEPNRCQTSERKARDSNPHAPRGALVSTEARPTVSGYLPSIDRCSEQNRVDRPGS